MVSIQRKLISAASGLAVFLGFLVYAPGVQAQYACTFHSTTQPLTDLGANEYYRLVLTNPYTFQPTGLIGGLYPGGSNTRPPAHEAAGIALAGQIQPLDSAGNPSAAGKIGLAGVGMSNTLTEFTRFMQVANADPEMNDNLVLVNGAMGGGTVEKWINPSDPSYDAYWGNLSSQITNKGLTDAQIQVLWVKITQLERSSFPGNMHNFETRLEELMRLLRAKFPNLKITYLSSRTRSYAYAGAAVAEPAAFDNAFGVRWLIEKQINGDMALNFDPNLGPAPVSYLAWGPYLWIDGENPRLDGRTWPVTNLMGDCVHPSSAGDQAVAEMLLEFMKGDSTSTPWFLNSGVPVPTPTPTPLLTPTPSLGPTPTPTAVPTPTPTATPTPTSAPSPTPTPTTIPLPTPTPVPGQAITSWGFASSVVTDDINGCTGCGNNNATWFASSIYTGGFDFNGTSATLNLGSFPYLSNKAAFSLVTWIKPSFDNTSTAWRSVFYDGSNVQVFYLGSNRYWRAVLRTTSSTYRISAPNTLTWTAGTWHQIAITYDGAVFKLYWDGIVVASGLATGPVAADSGSTMVGSNGMGSNYFWGDIDEIRAYDIALTQEQIEERVIDPAL